MFGSRTEYSVPAVDRTIVDRTACAAHTSVQSDAMDPRQHDWELPGPGNAPGRPPAQRTAGTEYSVLEPNIRFWDRIFGSGEFRPKLLGFGRSHFSHVKYLIPGRKFIFASPGDARAPRHNSRSGGGWLDFRHCTKKLLFFC